MGDPGLLHELPDSAALLPQGSGDREQPASADRSWAGLDGKAGLALAHKPVEQQVVVELIQQEPL
jgi:hypothetical protein